MALHAPSFCFQSDETSFHYMSQYCEESHHHLQQHTFTQLQGNILLLKFLLLHQRGRNPRGTNFRVFQNLLRLLERTVPYSNLCCHFPDCHTLFLSDDLIDLSLVSVEAVQGDHCGTDQQCVPFFKMLHASSDTACNHAGISVCMMMSCMNIQCVDFLLNKKFYHIHFQNNMSL
jgi:hypothetical protein